MSWSLLVPPRAEPTWIVKIKTTRGRVFRSDFRPVVHFRGRVGRIPTSTERLLGGSVSLLPDRQSFTPKRKLPPLKTWLTVPPVVVRSPSPGRTSPCAYSSYRSAHHSPTFPIMSWSPKPLGLNLPTGAETTQPSLVRPGSRAPGSCGRLRYPSRCRSPPHPQAPSRNASS